MQRDGQDCRGGPASSREVVYGDNGDDSGALGLDADRFGGGAGNDLAEGGRGVDSIYGGLNKYAWRTTHADPGFLRGTWIKTGDGSFTMQMPASVKPAVWGAIGGAVAAMIIGFSWGGWVTGGTAGEMAVASAKDASVLALTPLCVVKAEQQPEQVELLKKESSYGRGSFVTKAGWVANVNEKYRSAVASACASTLVDALDAKPVS